MDPESELVGRDEELAAIGSFLQARLPRVLVVEGEPGIGKTSVWRRGVAAARALGYSVAACEPAEAERALGYAAVRDLLEPIYGDVADRLPAPQRQALEGVLLQRPASAEEAAIAAAVLTAVRAAASVGSVLVAIDDAQWLDEASATTLAFVVRRLVTEPIAVLVAVRGTGAAALPLDLGRIRPSTPVERVTLGPLSLGALHRLIRRRVGPMSRPMLRRVHDASAGNPFFALEISRALHEADDAIEPGQPLPVPADVGALLGRRLATLPEPVREDLLVAALLARPRLEDLRAVSGSPETVLSNVESAEAAGIVHLHGQRVRFAHPLFAEAAAADALSGRRRSVHRRLAEVVRDDAERARHLGLGADGPNAAAAAAVEEAAARVADRGSPDTAAELAQLAARLTPRDDVDALERRRLAIAAHLHAAGRFNDAERHLRELLTELDAGPRRASALVLLARAREDDLELGTSLYEEAAEHAGEDVALQAEIRRYLSEAALVRGDLAGAVELAREALALTEESGDRRAVAYSIADLAHLETLAARVTPGLLERGVALEAELDSLAPYYRPSVVFALRLMFWDRLDESRELLERAYGEASAREDEYTRATLLYHLVQLEVRAGRWEVARTHADAGLELVDEIGVALQAGLFYASALVAAHAGDEERARTDAASSLVASRAANDSVFVLHVRGLLGLLELSVGDASAAVEQLDELPRIYASRGYGQPNVNPFVPDLVEALVLLGRAGDAAPHVGTLEERGKALGSPWASATGARCRGLVAAAAGDFAEALASLERALVEHERLPQPFELARTHLVHGAVLRRAKRRADARAELSHAIAIFDELPARLWAARAREEVARIGGRTSVGGDLTEAERRVAELAAGGSTNREVAEALFVTERTVEAALTRVYRKLGIRSRTELARKL